MEVCCTLGMLEEAQAKALKQAGLTAYNHNLDTSREFYPSVITTRSYDERLDTLALVRAAGISVCSGEKEGCMGYEMEMAVLMSASIMQPVTKTWGHVVSESFPEAWVGLPFELWSFTIQVRHA